MDIHSTVNEVLVNLFHQIWKVEEAALITDEYRDITVNDMHIIEAVGLGQGNNMSTIARKLNITVGSLTTSMNNLVLKEYVIRERSEEDRRVVNIRLTPKGERAYRHHEAFHEQMANAALQSLSQEEIPVLANTLQNLLGFFYQYEK
ncbi:MAG: MarR family transcriptional regulator [Lachnoclostridium sp.]|nr:MarR family transcriptional regulator [Lachnospira sp.]MCM1247576.1 MarR family transcriptional regulator [Lachnoclostridium sp.]MCM1534872.1 MarR family transcriptional regulator [Clostridium sp.]